MRHANDAEVIKIKNKLIGFNLGADYCAEHERGIKDIVREFQIDVTKIGIINKRIKLKDNGEAAFSLGYKREFQLGTWK